MHTTIILSLAFSSLWLLVAFVRGLRNPLANVPGPWYTRFTGVVMEYKWLRSQHAEYIQELHERYGDVVRIAPNAVDFCSPSAAKRIHTAIRPLRKSAMYDTLRGSDGTQNLFNSRDVDVHARHRKLLSAGMSEGNLKKVETLVQRQVSLAIERIGQDMKNKGAADVMKWWMFLATDVIGELTFGDSFRMLEQGKINQYASDLFDVTEHNTLQMAFPNLMGLATRIPLPVFSKGAAVWERFGEYAVQSIDRYERSVKAEPDNPKPTVFTKLFNASEEIMSKEEVVSNAMGYIIAGSDTTSTTMTYLTWAVCRDPSIKARLVSEVAGLPENYRDEDLKALPYLNQVMYETLRVYTSTPSLLPRDIPPGGIEIDGYWMPGGTVVQTQGYSMHRNASVFPNPEKFDPSRWDNPSEDMKRAWMPFGGGARVCIGMHLAQMEIRLAIAKFFRTYPNAKVSTLDGFCDDDMKSEIRLVMMAKGKRCLIQAS